MDSVLESVSLSLLKSINWNNSGWQSSRAGVFQLGLLSIMEFRCDSNHGHYLTSVCHGERHWYLYLWLHSRLPAFQEYFFPHVSNDSDNWGHPVWVSCSWRVPQVCFAQSQGLSRGTRLLSSHPTLLSTCFPWPLCSTDQDTSQCLVEAQANSPAVEPRAVTSVEFW